MLIENGGGSGTVDGPTATPSPAAAAPSSPSGGDGGGAGAFSETDLRDLFEDFDTDRSGTISVDELERALARLGAPRSRAEVVALVRESDGDHSGDVDFPEARRRVLLSLALCATVPPRDRSGAIAACFVLVRVFVVREGRRPSRCPSHLSPSLRH